MEGADEGEVYENEVKEILAKAEISVLLDTYDDIFSDFDPRPYSQRAISDDFLSEAKRATMDREGNFHLRFLIPKKMRNLNEEHLIKKRLREHFRKHAILLEQEIKKTRRGGIFMALLGAALLILATLIAHFFEYKNIFFTFLLILLEPAGWFTAWTGLDQLYYTVNEKKPDYIFYEKMTRAEITFISY